MALPKETQDRIVKYAAAAASKVNDTYRERETQFTNRISFLAGYKEGYIAGATTENEWAQKLVEALERTLADLNKNINPMLEAMGLHPLSLTAKDIEQTLQQWNAGKEPKFEGSRITEPAPGIALGCISPEARELLDTIMEQWEVHYKNMKEMHGDAMPETTFYGFAYWLVRWSGLIQPANNNPTK